eukprot:gnl/Dysnectes_brevis/2492_a2980_946.p1 GENE.gnl/Dysnectes_brevis/2492_a2980_946~~gnl/Dysnectes_brevis/2492_a2980_946.p1  ORF type:complete len:126 (-),score=3.08 gnl/Dysnectes_brevis/2492_a2980_946:71-448(-)
MSIYQLSMSFHNKQYILFFEYLMATTSQVTQVLHDSVSFKVTVELKTGDLFVGTLVHTEDNFNIQLEDVTKTSKTGQVTQMQHLFIRGSQVKFISLPPMLQNSPIFMRRGAQGLKRSVISIQRQK